MVADDKQKVMSLEVRDDGVAVLTVDIPNERMNVLNEAFLQQSGAIIDEVVNDAAIKAAVFISGKPGSFIAGADIKMLAAFETVEEGAGLSSSAQQALAKIEDSPKPFVAAIHGVALGGGYELALACHGRVASDDSKTAVGLPEVMLGLMPGAGGTQRLPKLIGLMPSLDLILTGRSVKAKKAKRMGMVDEVVPESILLEAAAKKALSLVGKKPQTKSVMSKLTSVKGIQSLLLEDNTFGREFLFKQATQRTLAKTKGNYPAATKILDVLSKSAGRGFKAYDLEASAFGELIVTPESQQLINIYFAQTEIKKAKFISSDAKAKAVNYLGVLGGGLMGGGIGFVSLDKAGARVRIKDIADNGIRGAIKHATENYQQRIRRRSISKTDARQKLQGLTGTLDYSGFKNIDLVIEAVFEDLSLKHQMVKDIETHGREDVIFASNTSSLRVKDIAEAAARPENVIGMHYFSPVEKMPLLEIIVHEKTADWVTATCVEFGRKQGKTVIVVKDGAGFYVNRILVPYMNQAGFLTMEGVSFEAIDKAFVKWGFPVGPIKLLDEVGIDVGNKMMPNMQAEFGSRMSGSGILDKMIEDKRIGKKVSKGFYLYDEKSKGKVADPQTYKLLGVSPNKKLDAEAIVERCVLPMLNEAVLSLEDGTVACARDGDIGAVFGIGFPPFRGGPFRYIDAVGADKIVEKLQALEQTHGDFFKPAATLLEMASSGKKFYE